MPISHAHKLIFIHIPKTGGTSIEAALGMHGKYRQVGKRPYRWQRRDYSCLFGAGVQHFTLAEVRSHLYGARFSDYRFMGGIKHSLDVVMNRMGFGVADKGRLIYEQYHKFSVVRNPYARLVSHFSWMDGKWFKGEESGREEFEEFIERMLMERLYLSDLHLIPQWKYLIVDGEIGVDTVLHLESLSDEFEVFCKQRNIAAKLERRMASKHAAWEEYFTEDLKKKVYPIYEKDFEYFSYDRGF